MTVTTQDLLPSEVVFVAAMQQLGFGLLSTFRSAAASWS